MKYKLLTKKKAEEEYARSQRDESIILNILNHVSDIPFQKDSYGNSFFDFICTKKKIVIELKSRQVKKNKYRETLVGYNKIQSFTRFNDRRGNKWMFIIMFKFLDGVYFFRHYKNEKYKVKIFRRNVPARIEKYPKKYVFYPVNKLRPLKELPIYISPKIQIRFA